MTVAERFARDLDAYFARKEREKFLCCRAGMSSDCLRMGMKAWLKVQDWKCPSCGTRWHRREAELGWNLIVA